jgi:hypothetical protein
VASAILVELNIRLTVLVVETARLERRGVNDRLSEAPFRYPTQRSAPDLILKH